MNPELQPSQKEEEAARFSRKPEKREAEPGARGVERKSCGGGAGISMRAEGKIFLSF